MMEDVPEATKDAQADCGLGGELAGGLWLGLPVTFALQLGCVGHEWHLLGITILDGLAVLGFLALLLLLLLDVLGSTVEEEIGHHLPWLRATDLTAETLDLTGKEPPDQTN